MAKQSAKLNNYSGGIDLATSERDIESNECVDARNVGLYRPGLLILGHKAVSSGLISGSSLLTCGGLGAGFHQDGRKAWKKQQLVAFSSSHPFANTFAGNYGSGMTGVTVANHNIKTTTNISNSAYGTNYGINTHTFGEVSEFHDNFENYLTPAVDWVIGNELPKPARCLFQAYFQHEWARWHYEVNATLDMYKGETYTAVNAGTGGIPNLYTYDWNINDYDWSSANDSLGDTGSLNYPPTGGIGGDMLDSRYWDMACIQNPNRKNVGMRLNPTISGTGSDASSNGGSTSGNGFMNASVQLHVAPKMSLRFDRMMSGPNSVKSMAVMPTNPLMYGPDGGNGEGNVANGELYCATRLRPGTWYRFEIRYHNPTHYSCDTFGLAYDQTLMYDFDNTNGGYTCGLIEDMHYHGNMPGVSGEFNSNIDNIKSLKGQKCYNWLDVDASTDNGNHPEWLKFNLKPNVRNGFAAINFKTKEALYDDDWSVNLSSTYFSLCFSTMLKINASGAEASDGEEWMYFDNYVTKGQTINGETAGVSSNLNHKNFKAYIAYLCADVKEKQDIFIESDIDNDRNYSGEGDDYLLFSGKGTTYPDGGVKNSWLYSTAAGKWTQESNFEHTHILGLYPNILNKVLSTRQRRNWLQPFQQKHDERYNTYTDNNDNFTLDAYFVNEGLRLKDTTTHYDYGVWFGHISKHMYYGATNYWDAYNHRYNGHWDISIGAWKESGWFLLDKRFNPPESGRFCPSYANIAVKDNAEWWRPPLNKMRDRVLDTEPSDDGWPTPKISTSSSYFPLSMRHASGSVESPQYQGISNLDCNGHDINVRLQFNAKGGFSNTIESALNLTEFDPYDEEMTDDLKKTTIFGISYLYDGVKDIKFEDGPEQETGIIWMKHPPYWRDPGDTWTTHGADIVGDGEYHLNPKTFYWRPNELTYVQPFRLSWTHGPRYFRANPRLSGFRVYMKQKDEGQWGDFALLAHVSFVDGKYFWYGQDTEAEYYIREMTTIGQTDHSIFNFGGPNYTDVESKFSTTGHQNDWYGIDEYWNDKEFGFLLHKNRLTTEGYHMRRDTFEDPFVGCMVDIGSNYQELGSTTDEKLWKMAGTHGEHWCTNVHPLKVFPENRISKEMRNFHDDTLDWIPRYKCSTILRNRVFIGNIYDSVEHPSRVIVSPVEKYDTFSQSEYLDYDGAIEDDPIIELDNYNDKLIVFKRYSIHIVNPPEAGELQTVPLMILESNGIRKKHHVIKSYQGIAWFNKYGLWFFDGKTTENLLEKEITLAEKVTVRKKRITDEIWQRYFNHDDSFITYDGQKNQLIIGSNLGENNNELSDENNKKVEFIYDFTTKGFTRGSSMFTNDIMCIPIVDRDGIPSFFKINSEDGSLDLQDDENSEEFAYMKIDNDLKNNVTKDVLLITKDLDFRDPSKRKKFYKLYITFKSNQYYEFEQTDINDNFTLGAHNSEYVKNSKIKIYYALNGTKDWKEFDFDKSINYTDTGSATSDEGEHGLVIWEDTDQAITTFETATEISNNSATVEFHQCEISGNYTDTIKPGMAIKVNNEVIVIEKVGFVSSTTRTILYFRIAGRGINSANPNEVTPSTIATHSVGSTAYVFTNNWAQATLIPKTTDTDKNSFYSIQFKVESVESSDGTKRFVPSRFELNDMNIVFREKGLR